MKTEGIKKYLTGQFSKRQLTHILCPLFILTFSIFLLLAWITYPPELEYSIFTNTISNLGNQFVNTTGWYFLSLVLFSLGFQIIPIFIYVHRRLTLICRHTARTGTVFAILGACSIFSVGIVSEVNQPTPFGISQVIIHAAIAIIGGLFLALALLFYLFVILKDHLFKRGHRQFPLLWVFLSYGFMIFLGVLLGLSEYYKYVNNIPYPGTGLLAFPFYEWSLMVSGVGFLVVMCFWFPENIEPLKDK